MRSPFFRLMVAMVAGIVVLAGYCIWYAVVAEKSASVAEVQNRIDAAMETASRVASARAAIAEIADDKTALQGYFVSENGVVAFINNLEAWGQTQGATVNILSVSAGTGTRPTLVFSLTVKGPFDAVMRTVGVIEYAPYDLSISEFSLAQDAGTVGMPISD